ncbi:hypothetical protein FQN57_001235 [Myotisia sp. PD_48]|nr:hypothetical protein FQN57_001235 [Myotisia sp. PD_48]
MAKTAKLKSSTKSKSVRSRAARREGSPSLNLDKSLTSLERAEKTAPTIPSVLGAQHGSGVSKKSKKPAKSRAQRLRQEKGLERAEMVMDIKDKKINRSLHKVNGVNARKATWDDLNKKIARTTRIHNDTEDQDQDDAEVMVTKKRKGKSEVPATKPPSGSAPATAPVAMELEDFELDGEIT